MNDWLANTWFGRLFQPPVRLWPAVAAILAFCTIARLTILFALSFVPGIDVPDWAWGTGFIGTALVAAPLSIFLLNQLSRNHKLGASLSEANAAMLEAYAAMKVMAETDELTGLRNRRAFLAEVAQRRQASEWFIVGDVDDFKHVNDRFGHAQGDAALKAIAAALDGAVPPSGFSGRLGGEEFAVYLPNTDRDVALAAGERIRAAVAALAIAMPDGSALRPTISLGVAGGDHIELVETGFGLADRAMYEAKHTGRNRVRAAGCAAAPQSAVRKPPALTMNSATAPAPSPLAMAANT